MILTKLVYSLVKREAVGWKAKIEKYYIKSISVIISIGRGRDESHCIPYMA